MLMVKDSCAKQEKRQEFYYSTKDLTQSKQVAVTGGVEPKGQMKGTFGITRDLYGCLVERMGIPRKYRDEAVRRLVLFPVLGPCQYKGISGSVHYLEGGKAKGGYTNTFVFGQYVGRIMSQKKGYCSLLASVTMDVSDLSTYLQEKFVSSSLPFKRSLEYYSGCCVPNSPLGMEWSLEWNSMDSVSRVLIWRWISLQRGLLTNC